MVTTTQIVMAHHDQIVSWARFCAGFGRGAVFAFLPDSLPVGQVREIAPMNFTRASTLQSRALTGNEIARVALEMVDTYDSATQIVVVAHVEGRSPVCFTLSVASPMVIHSEWP